MKTPESATDNNVGIKVPENVPETNVGKINEIMPGAIKRELGEEIPVHYHLPNPEPRLTPKELMKLQQLHGTALVYIEQLENAVEFYGDRAQGLESRLAQVERERDALLDDLQHTFDPCNVCKKKDVCEQYCPENDYDCPECKDKHRCICHNCTSSNDLWEWRGICSENTKEETK